MKREMPNLNNTKFENVGTESRDGNTRNHNSRGFEMFGKVGGDWPPTKPIKKILTITLARLEPCKTLKNYLIDNFC